MPPLIEISNAGRHVGEEVSIRGWLYNKRESGKLLFPLIRDGSGIMQGVVVKSHGNSTVESFVRAIGQARQEVDSNILSLIDRRLGELTD